MEKKVYIVVDGDYSDYHIIGVYSSKVRAEKFCDNYNFGDYNHAKVETYTLNATDEEWYMNQYFVIGIFMDTGEVDFSSQQVTANLKEGHEYIPYTIHRGNDTYRRYYIPNREGMTMDKATKIVIEKRQRWLSEQ